MEEPDIESEQIVGNVRVCLASECCGDEMKEYNFEVEHDLASEIAAFRKEHKLSDDDEIEGELSLEAEMTSRRETKDRNGKPIKSARYMKTFYGFSASGTMTLRAEKGKKQVETEIEVAFDDDVQASSFEELY
jgi:hypothetical protein